MVKASIWEENRHVVLRQPRDTLKIKNYQTFTATELVDVQPAANVLATNVMPIVRMTRSKAWPSLCDAIAEWMVKFESTRADLLRTERTSWRQHEQVYKDGLLQTCLACA